MSEIYIMQLPPGHRWIIKNGQFVGTEPDDTPVEPFVEKSLLEKIRSFASAYTSGQHVSPERMEARFQICSACPEFGRTKLGGEGCTICGCRMGPDDKTFPNLVAFEETKEYGCFFYAKQRNNKNLSIEQRSKWKERGV